MARQDLGKIVSEITNVNVTVDNNVGVPSAEASISGTLTEKELSINFKNLKGEKGDKPIKGTDYFTEEEKQQFATETVGLVTAEGEKQITAIGEKGTAETQKVTAEGTKQTNSVKNQGTTSLNAVKKVQTDIEALLNNQTASGNALSLNGKTGVQYDKEIQGVAGGYSGNFPLTTAELNGVYLLPSTGKFYVCIKAYNGTQISAPNANFEELSVYKNRDRLENLFTIKSFTLDWSKAQYNENASFYYLNKNFDTKKRIQLLFISTYSDRLRNIQVAVNEKKSLFKLFEFKDSNNFSSTVYYIEY